MKIIALEPSRLKEKTGEKEIPDDPKIITCSLDNTIRLWDSVKIEPMNVLQAPEYSEISCMTFLVKSCLVATGHEDGSIRLWNMDISSSVLLKSPKYQHTNSISCIIGVIELDEEYLVAGSYDGSISIWDVNPPIGKDSAGNQVSQIIKPQFSHMIDNAKFCDLSCFEGEEVLSIHYFEDDMFDKHNGYLVVGGNSKEIQVYRFKDSQYKVTMTGHTDSVTCIAEDGKMLLTGSDDMRIAVWNTHNWYYEDNYSKGKTQKKYVEAVGFMSGHTASIEDLCILPNGILLSCSFDKKIKVW